MAYMNVVSGKYMMKGGEPPTLFGLIGSAQSADANVKSLGGLVSHKADGKVPSGLKKEKVADKTEHHIGGKNATAIPGVHMGQVPYPGVYMKDVGKKL